MMADKTVKAPEPTKLEALRTEIIDILTEYLDELYKKYDEDPGEHHVDRIRTARDALNIFQAKA